MKMYAVKCRGDKGFILLLFLLCSSAGWSAERAEPFDPVSSLYEKGNEYFRRGAYTSAISVFQLVSDNHPEHVLAPEALFSIASVRHKMGDHSASRATYEELLKKYPNASATPDALLQLGSEHLEQGNAAAAQSVWDRLIKEYRGSIASKIAEQRRRSVQESASALPVAPERPIAAAGSDILSDQAKDVEEPAMSDPALLPMPSAPEAPRLPHAEGKSKDRPATYRVRKGDSLSKIAKSVLGSTDRYRDLAKFNKIPPPYTLTVGQELKIPGRGSESAGHSSSLDESRVLPVSEKSPPIDPPRASMEKKVGAEKPAPAWDAMPVEAMEKAAGSIEKWVDNRAEGYESLQTRLLELQHDVRGQKVLEKQVEILKTQLEAEKTQNSGLKQEVIGQIERLKEMKDKNTALLRQMETMADSVDRTKAEKARLLELDAQTRAYRQKMETLEKQNEVLSETLQKMRDAFDAQIGLVKAYYDSQLTQTRTAYEIRLDTTTTELARLREDARKKEESLNEIKKDYADLMKKTATIQKEVFEEKQSRVSLAASRQALEKAQDLRRSGKTKEAEAAYRDALRLYPDFPDAMNGLAYLFAEEKRDLDEAEKLVERAISVDPQGRGYYLDTLGWIHYVRTAYASALDVLHESYRRIPTEDLPARAAVSFHIGKVYQAMSDKDKAFFHFIDAIKLAPRTRWATLSERELDAL